MTYGEMVEISEVLALDMLLAYRNAVSRPCTHCECEKEPNQTTHLSYNLYDLAPSCPCRFTNLAPEQLPPWQESPHPFSRPLKDLTSPSNSTIFCT